MRKTNIYRGEERSHLKRFMESLADSPQGELCFGDSPDLVIVTRTHRIGIEHTQLVQQKDEWGRGFPKAAESLQTRCVETAQELYEERCADQDLYVHVYFSPRPLRKADVPRLAQRITELVTRFAPAEPNSETTIEAWRHNRDAPGEIPLQIEEIWIKKPEGRDRLWGVPRGGVVESLDSARIQAELDLKNGRVAKYRWGCDEIWLLLVADGFSPATDLRLSDEVSAECFLSDFDRVFYFHNFSRRVSELKISRHDRTATDIRDSPRAD